MKKIISILGAFLLISLLAFSSCKKTESQLADKQLSEAVAGLTLPITLKDGSTLTECEYNDKVLTFVCDVNEAKFKKMDSEKSKASTVEQLNKGLFPRNLVNNIIKADAAIKYVMVCGADTLSYDITAGELEGEN